MRSKQIRFRLFIVFIIVSCISIQAQIEDSLAIKKDSNQVLEKANPTNSKKKLHQSYLSLTEDYAKKRAFKEALISIKESFKYCSTEFEEVLSLIQEGTIYVDLQEYDKALSDYFKALRIAKKNGFIKQEIRISTNIANIRLRLWEPRIAVERFKDNLKLLEHPKVISDTLFYRKATLALEHLIGATYNDLDKPDSALYFLNRVLKKSHTYQMTASQNDYLINVGRSHHFLNQCDSALWYYDKALKGFKIEGKDRNLENLNFKIGRCLYDTHQYKESILYFKKIDTTIIKEKSTDIRFLNLVRDAFHYISEAYYKEDSISISNHYHRRFKYYDQIHDEQRVKLLKRVHEEFDKQLLEDELSETLSTATTFKHKYWNMIAVSSLLILLIILGTLYSTKQRKRNKKSYLTLLDKITALENAKKESVKNESNQTVSIPSEKVTRILTKLSKLEKEGGFLLRKECTLATLAKKLGTNTMYLSKTINTHKGSNFSSYLTNIRLEHGILRLKNDTTFRNYSIKSIAEELGFKSDQSFSRAFKKHTGIYPSYYIKNLKSEK